MNLVLAYAAPLVAFSPLEFGVTAAIFGGITLSGGRGTVLGVAIGVIALSVVQEGLVIAAASDATTNIVTGSLLGCVALITAREMRFAGLREWVSIRKAPANDGMVLAATSGRSPAMTQHQGRRRELRFTRLSQPKDIRHVLSGGRHVSS